MSKPISVIFDGEPRGAVQAFDKVGDASVAMAKKVDNATDSHVLLSERVGNTEGRFMGLADVMDGMATAFGIPIDGAINMARAAGDVTGGLSNLSGIIPSVMSKFPMLAGAMTMVTSHPIMTAFVVGGAIIGGLILLEKKFGVVSGAVEGLGGAFSWTWDRAIKPAINGILGGTETLVNGLSAAFNGSLGRIPGIPNIPRVNLPRLDVGGTVLQTGIAVVHRGEVVTPAADANSGGRGVTVVVNVYGSVTTERELVDTVHAGLLRKQVRSGNLGIKAA